MTKEKLIVKIFNNFHGKEITNNINSSNKGLMWVITTMKRHNGLLLTVATESKMEDDWIVTSHDSQRIYLNNFKTKIRVTDKTLIATHTEALNKFLKENKDKYTGEFEV
jgi:hypothetical protein